MSIGPNEVCHVTQTVAEFVEREAEHERRLLETLIAAHRREHDLAYKELQRHLEALNHAHENMDKDRRQYLTIDTHDRFYGEYREWSGKISTQLANIQGRAQATTYIIGIVFVILQIVIGLFLKYSMIGR